MSRRLPRGAFELEVGDLADDGRGIGRIEGKAVFVDGALPDERIRFEYRRRRSRHDEGSLLEVLHASSQRVQPPCPHFGVCGGCSLQHLDAQSQLLRKQSGLLESLRRIGGVVPQALLPPVTGPLWHYRRRARLGVKDVPRKGRVLVGFRERHAPYVTDMRLCEVLDQRLAGMLETLSELVAKLSVRRRLPQIDVAAGDGAVALAFRVLDPPSVNDLWHLQAFARHHDVQVYLQPGGPDTLSRLAPTDAPPLSYRLPEWELEMQFQPGQFIQVNASVNRKLIALALDLLAPGPESQVLDLFCGLGNFSLPLARRAARVVAVEGDAELVSWAGRNAQTNAIHNVEFQQANLMEENHSWSWNRPHYDGVLLDPPRSGAVEVLPIVAAMGPRRIVYVSCHPGTLARDAALLVERFGFQLQAAGVLDMFPHTTHVESIALFESGG